MIWNEHRLEQISNRDRLGQVLGQALGQGFGTRIGTEIGTGIGTGIGKRVTDNLLTENLA